MDNLDFYLLFRWVVRPGIRFGLGSYGVLEKTWPALNGDVAPKGRGHRVGTEKLRAAMRWAFAVASSTKAARGLPSIELS